MYDDFSRPWRSWPTGGMARSCLLAMGHCEAVQAAMSLDKASVATKRRDVS
jgi:hypothetical protein